MGAAGLASARTLNTAGVQLYTVRSIIDKDPAGVLAEIEKIGYREAEVTWATLTPLWSALRSTSLKPVSAHLDTLMFGHDGAKLPAAIGEAASKGFRYVVCPYVRPEDRGGAETMKRLGETLTKAGEIAHKSGLTLCYHNHAFEFAKDGDKTLLDILLESSDPKLVHLEMDVMWVTIAGADPVELLRRYMGRVPLLHLKDLHRGVPNRLDEKVERTAFAEVGAGRVDFPRVLKAAAVSGTRHYFVEQDQTPGDPLASLRTSFGNLRKIRF